MQETVTAAAPTTYWQDIREAIRGSQRDFTEGSIGRAIVLLAIPMVLEMAMESLFAIVDVFWVAHLGANAIATVGLSESILTLIYCVAMGLSMAITAMVARRIGEKDPEGAAVATVQGLAAGIVGAIAMSVTGALFATRLLAIMGASPDVIATGHQYAAIILGGSISVVLLFVNNGAFRGAGDAAVAMRVLWVSNLINLVLDPCFIFGIGPFPRLGVTGAAVSTTCGRSIGVIYQFWILFRGSSRLRIVAQQMRVKLDVLVRLVRVAINGMFQYGIGQISWMIMVRIVSTFGSAALAGYTIGIRVIIFVILPSWGFASAAATLVGQNLGAQKPDRAERSVWMTGFYNMLFLGGVALILIIFPESIIRLFTNDPEVVPFGVACLRIISYGNLAYAYGMVMVQSFNGAGDTFTPTVVNIFCYWLFQIPVAYILAFKTSLGPKGSFAAIPIAETLIAIVGVILFRRGRWKKKRI
ncbi:MAG TPA: MATE family efflux transporter [Terriglobia bacterium]|nr:MATE family efflux transporter [Terriglobia bacterium]